MIAQALNAVFFIPFIGNAIELSLQRNGGVEGGLKGTYQHSIRSQLLKPANSFQIRNVVSRGYYQIFFHTLQNFWCQLVNSIMILGKYGFKTYTLQFLQIGEYTVFVIEEAVKKHLNPLCVGRNTQIFPKDFKTIRLFKMKDGTVQASYSFHFSFCQYLVPWHNK